MAVGLFFAGSFFGGGFFGDEFAVDSGVSFPHVAHFSGVSQPTIGPAPTYDVTYGVSAESPNTVTKIEFWEGDTPP